MPSPRSRRRWLWLVAAAVLLLAGAFLMLSTEPPIPPEPRTVNTPTRMSPAEQKRGEARRTVVWLPPAVDGGPPAPPRRPSDPLMALMPPEVKRGAVVAEVSAIVHSELGPKLLQCLFGDEQGALGRLRDAGLDPRTALDRVAVIDGTLVLTGQFQGGGWTSLLPGQPTVSPHGDRSSIYEWSRPDGGTFQVGAWGGQLLVMGQDRAGLEATLDRLQGQGPAQPGVLTEDQAYGEVYGVVTPDALGEVVSREDPRLGETLRDAARTVQLHADLSSDVGLVADIEGSEAGKTEDLRRALGGALSLGRMRAQAQGRDEEAQLLDRARVTRSDDGKFRLQAGLPREYLDRVLSDCIARRRAPPADGGH